MRRALLGFAIAGGTLVAFLLLLDPAAIWGVLRQASIAYFAAGLIAVFLAVACWAESMRRVLLAAGGTLGPLQGFAAYTTGMFAKQVLPMGNAGGIAIMAYAIDLEADLDFERSLAVVTIGDFLGLLSTVFLAFVGILYVVLTLPPSNLVQAATIGVIVVGASFATIG
ncbi:MAG: lysylphosphatidylglycerol synthase domain-containing protein, partial [Salinirussus sp.]